MKRNLISIIFLLLASISMSAQEDPELSKLYELAKSLDRGTVSYVNGPDGLYKLTIINNQLYYYPDSVGKDAVNSERLDQEIRRVLEHLSHTKKDIYHVEMHDEAAGIDTIRYAILIRTNKNFKHTQSNDKEYVVNDRNVLEYVDYEFADNTMMGGTWHHKYAQRGQSRFRHYTLLDSTVAQKPFDVTAFSKSVKPILQQEGVTVRKVHYQHEGGKEAVRDMHYFQMNRIGYGDSYGVHYIVRSREQGERIYNQLKEAAQEYASSHPDEKCDIELTDAGNGAVVEILTGEDPAHPRTAGKEWSQFGLYSLNDEGVYHFLLLNTKGEAWIPLDWQIIKERTNDKIIYYEDDRIPGQPYWRDFQKNKGK